MNVVLEYFDLDKDFFYAHSSLSNNIGFQLQTLYPVRNHTACICAAKQKIVCCYRDLYYGT